MNWRFEKKIALGQDELEYARVHLLSHPIGLRTAFPNRVVNNVYFDTLDLYSFSAHVAGIEARAKWRLRAYDSGPWKVLEEKRKVGEHGDKIYLNPEAAVSALSSLDSVLINERELYPVIQNKYFREYFHSPLWGIRVTIDTKIQFSKPKQDIWQTDSECFAVIEVKYDLENAKAGEAFMHSLPWRLNRYSKYVRGMRLLDLN